LAPRNTAYPAKVLGVQRSIIRRANCVLSRQYKTGNVFNCNKEIPMTYHQLPSETSRDIQLTVHARGLELKNSHHRAIRRIISNALGRFARRVRMVHVSLEDINGPRGGVDIRCRIEVHFRPRGSITVSALAVDQYAATAEAAVRARELVDRCVKKVRSRRREALR